MEKLDNKEMSNKTPPFKPGDRVRFKGNPPENAAKFCNVKPGDTLKVFACYRRCGAWAVDIGVLHAWDSVLLEKVEAGEKAHA